MTLRSTPHPQDPTALQSGRRGPEAIAVVSVFSAVAAVTVGLRIISRRIKKADWLASDYTIVLGLVGSWIVSGLVLAEVHYGVGKHIGQVEAGEGDLTQLLQFTYAAQIAYAVSISIIKISILSLYRSLFPGHGFAIITNVVGAFVIAWGICVGFMSTFSCVPIRGNWDFTVSASCINGAAFVTGVSVPNILIDVMILCLAVVKVWNLQMTTRQKCAVIGMFLTGSFVIIASIIRISTVRSVNPEDVSWSTYGIAIWSAIEISMAVISACLPTLRPFFDYITPKRLHFSFGNSKSSQAHDIGPHEAQISNTESLRHLQPDALISPLPKPTATLQKERFNLEVEEDEWMRDEGFGREYRGVAL